ncbi:MAG: U32 family peptidase [Ruminococcaceae bacterium]|nr:U32 family peptidase [Oscillospiraceae bacterium]
MNKVELLAPAGSLEKLKVALIYGADAVYIGGEEFSLRVAAKNFTNDEIKEGIDFAHKMGKKVYITANIIGHNDDIKKFPEFVKEVEKMDADAIIISDLGMFSIAREVAPNLEIHVSTQANNVNYATANMWNSLGAKRIVLGRDLSLEEIKEIRKNIKDDFEIECFVHGAMCISYSGRCLLSNFMASRDANMGACAHPCRWKYSLVEEKRPGEYMPVFENERGTFIFNSKDLCMIEHIPELIEAGITSFKVEGRVKNELYIATVIGAYRRAIDAYYADRENYKLDKELTDELTKISYRRYTTGFFFGKPSSEDQVYDRSTYIQEYKTAGVVLDYNSETKQATIEQRNRFFVGDEIEVITPNKRVYTFKIDKMINENDEEISVAPHPQMIVKMKIDYPVEKYSILRKKEDIQEGEN